MREIQSIIESVADTDATVLIRGESGVGKDLVARAIHAHSERRQGPFIKVNCAAIPQGLLESELFGHEKGAFTGAHRRKAGQFEFAKGGTIYLDEIAELPLGLQAKLLHVLQDFKFARVGGHELITVDARVVAATNRDLEKALVRGEFREDLYYRLNVVELMVPPLRERREEIPLLVSWFLDRFNEQYGRNKRISPETLARLTEHEWSGNVRELENTIRRMVVLADGEQAFEMLAARCRNGNGNGSAYSSGNGHNNGNASNGNGHSNDNGHGNGNGNGHGAVLSAARASEGLREIARRGAREAERKALVEVLERVHWNRAEASRILKVSYKTLLNKIAECQLTSPRRG